MFTDPFKKYYYILFSIMISSSLVQSSLPIDSEKEGYTFYSQMNREVMDIYASKPELEKTISFQALSLSETLFGISYSIYTQDASSFLSKLGRYHSVFLKPVNYLIEKTLPTFVQEPLKGVLKDSMEMLTYHQIAEYGSSYFMDTICGIMGVYLVSHSLNSYDIDSKVKREIQAVALWGFGRMGWHSAQCFKLEIGSFLQSFIMQNLDPFDLPKSFFVEGYDVHYESENICVNPYGYCDGYRGTEYSECRIKTDWAVLQECLSTSDPNKLFSCKPHYQETYDFQNESPSNLYTSLERLKGGTVKPVISRAIKFNKEVQETALAIRSYNNPYKSFAVSDVHFYGRLKLIYEYTNIYTKTYGTYFGPYMPDIDPGLDSFFHNQTHHYTEMEYVPYSAFDGPRSLAGNLPESFWFEMNLGEWLLTNIASMYLSDRKGRNIMYDIVDYGRIYSIGSENYYIDSEIIPKHVDYDQSGSLDPMCYVQSVKDRASFFASELPNSFKKYYYNNYELDLFSFISKYFLKNKLSQEQYIELTTQNNSIKVYDLTIPVGDPKDWQV